MRIYEKQPSDEILVRFAFDECPSAGHIRLCSPDGSFRDYPYRQMRGIAQPPDNERNDAMDFSVDYLWKLMQARQAAWRAAHPHAEMTFV